MRVDDDVQCGRGPFYTYATLKRMLDSCDRRGCMSLVSLRESKLYFSCAHASNTAGVQPARLHGFEVLRKGPGHIQPNRYVISRSSGRTPHMWCALIRPTGVEARACLLFHCILRSLSPRACAAARARARLHGARWRPLAASDRMLYRQTHDTCTLAHTTPAIRAYYIANTCAHERAAPARPPSIRQTALAASPCPRDAGAPPARSARSPVLP
jgi:hypothetical protein